MPTELFSTLLDRIKEATDQYNALTFAGMGEPLLDPEFLEKARVARSKGFRVLLLTNGSRLTLDLFRELDKIGIESVRISFYGLDAKYPHEYDEVLIKSILNAEVSGAAMQPD